MNFTLGKESSYVKMEEAEDEDKPDIWIRLERLERIFGGPDQ